MTPTTQQDISRINQAFNEVGDTLVSLYSRWLDEREYENIEDYKVPIQTILTTHQMRVVKMTKRPFGFHFMIGDDNPAVYSAFVNSSKYGWKRIC